MRILSLNLIAFGPFRDCILDLSGGKEGLHLIYGPNEAGKSAALRAIENLLYGIPTRTQDNFRFDNTKLRLGASIRGNDGKVLEIIRRKGRKDTLLKPDQSILPDAVLEAFLGTVTQNMFSNFFGLDHKRLVEGGKALIEGKGDVGQSLFSAGMGSANLQQILRNLQTEAEALFKPGGSRPTINALLSQYKDQRSYLRGLTLKPKDWEEHDRALREAQDNKEKVNREIENLNRRLLRYQRLQRALPHIGKWRQVCKDISDMGDVVELPSDFSAQRQEVQENLRVARSTLQKSKEELVEVESAIQNIVIPKALIQQDETIGEFYQSLKRYKKDQDDLPKRRQKYQIEVNELVRLLNRLDTSIDLDNVNELHLTELQRDEIEGMGERYKDLRLQEESIERDLREKASSLDDLKKSLKKLPPARDYLELKIAINKAHRAGDLESRMNQLKADLDSWQREIQIKIKALGLWTGTAEDLEIAHIPLRDTVQRYSMNMSNLQNQHEKLENKVAELSNGIEDLQSQIETLTEVGAVPQERDLLQARQQRELQWSELKQAWGDQQDIDSEAISNYEKNVSQCDVIADRLRRESDRVAKLAQLRAAHETQSDKLFKAQTQLQATSDKLVALNQEWEALWKPMNIKPLPPKEMIAWLEKRSEIVHLVEEKHKLTAEHDQVLTDLNKHRSQLTQALKELGKDVNEESDTFGDLLDRAENLAEAVQKTESKRQDLNRRLDETKRDEAKQKKELNRIQKELKTLLADWAEAIQTIQLREATNPDNAVIILRLQHEITQKYASVQELDNRIRGIERDIKDFESEVQGFCSNYHPELEELAADQAVRQLHTELTAGKQELSRLNDLKKRQEKLNDDIRNFERKERETFKRQSELCRIAKCKDPDQLPELEVRSQQYVELRQKKDEYEKLILTESAGMPLEKFVADAEKEDADALPGHITELETRLNELETKRNELDQIIGQERTELKHMQDSIGAADLVQESQDTLARMRDAVERYTRLRLATVILKQEIERYRKESQGPILQRASELFRRLTLESFDSLEIGYDDNDNPLLVGVRPNGMRVGSEGWSDGTADQLYLALRLASLEQHLEAREPLPLILDDILINFDNERSSATLKILADLSARLQIIFFTHHKHMIELARKVVPKEVLQVQTLG